jgi:hypothetical protein
MAKTKTKLLALGIGLFAVASATSYRLVEAGWKSASPAWAWKNPDGSGAGMGGGDLGATRAVGPGSAEILTQIFKNEGKAPWALVSIWNGQSAPNGMSAYCTTSDPEMLANLRSLNGDEHLGIEYAADGHCTTVWIMKSSALQPKVP